MTELRTDYLTGSRVVIAPIREDRPMGFEQKIISEEASEIACPFCIGNEHMTPGIIKQNGDVWVTPNLYPAFEAGSISGFGRHEIVIDTSNHSDKLHHLSAEQISDALMMLKDRYLDFTEDKRIEQVQVFKNVGMTSGASIPHSHWQVVGIPFVPDLHRLMLWNFAKYKEQSGGCYLCSVKKELIIYKNSETTTYAPYASPFSYMLNILPKEHISNIGQLSKETSAALGDALKTSLSALVGLFFEKELNYNILIYSSPPYETDSDKWHLYLQIVPRLGFLGGYEIATGCYINSVTPEDAAKRLRKEVTLLTGEHIFYG